MTNKKYDKYVHIILVVSIKNQINLALKIYLINFNLFLPARDMNLRDIVKQH